MISASPTPHQPHYKCFDLTVGLERAGQYNKIERVALYALTALATLTGVGAIFWLACRSKIKAHHVGLQFFSILGTLLLAMTPVVGWGILYGVKHLIVEPRGKYVVRLQSALSDLVLVSLRNFSDRSSIRTSTLWSVPEPFSVSFQKIEDCLYERNTIPIFSPWHVSPSYDRLRLVRTQLSSLVSSNEFQELQKRDPKDPFALHILTLCHLIRMGGTSKQPFSIFGHIFTEPVLQREGKESQSTFSLAEVSDTLTEVIQSYQGQNHESIADSFAHWILSPTKTIASLISETNPRQYNSYLMGNMDNMGWTYEVSDPHSPDRKPISYDFHYGPGPHDDPLMRADLSLYSAFFKDDRLGYRGPVFIQHNLQKQLGADGVRSRMQYEMATDHPGQIFFMTTPMDGDIWKLKGKYFPLPFPSIGEFCTQYLNFAKGSKDSHRQFPSDRAPASERAEAGNGYFLPEVLTDSEIELAFKLVGEKVRTPLPEEIESKRMVLKGSQLLVQAALLLKTMVHATNSSYERLSELDREVMLNSLDHQLRQLLERSSLGQSCKQNIDRGMALNIVTRLLVMQMAGQSITRPLLDEIVGEVIGRAEIVDRRLIMLDRLNPALCALHLIHENPDFVTGLKSYLGAEIKISDPENVTIDAS